MSSIKDLTTGLTLLAKYDPKGVEHYIDGADHDVIYGGGEPHTWAEEDVLAMLDAGWHVHDGNDEEPEDDGPDRYDVEETKPFDFARWKTLIGEDGFWATYV